MGAGEEEEPRPRIILVPYPAQGHVTPMLRLASALHARGFRPTLAAPDFVHRRLTARADPDDDRVGFASIPTGLGDDLDFFAIERAMEDAMPPHLERLLRDSPGVACVVVDLLASWAVGVAARCGVPAAGFWPAMLASYRLISAIPELIRRGLISDSGIPLRHCTYRHHHQQQELLSTKDLPWLIGNPSSQKSRFAFWVRTLDRTTALRSLLINSFTGEGGEHDEHPRLSDHGPRIYQIGPLLGSAADHRQSPSMWDEDRSCVEWLGTQRPSSVVYVSFGSWVGPIGAEKVAELAHGLEATGRPFLWVLRDGGGWRSGLPEGYHDRVAGRGRVVGWAPQEEVLGHWAVGCYLTHCGWNSTLEAVRHGRRLLCHPVSGDQFVNCAHIVRVWGIGILLGDVERCAVGDGIRRVMEGEEGAEMEGRVVELRKRVMGDEGIYTAAADLQHFIDAIKQEHTIIGAQPRPTAKGKLC